ncbi:DUF2510 domain-containing protein [Microcella sp.]|uniref:DUF2510 domain-containing protein n=1 Tax=Microcella sp. TaxID=1913979 RepID=UPI0025D0A9A2|nr:DUF2510 domain-containing protein [Microcella sp.]
MTNTTTVRVPAGWYPDPVTLADSGAATQRRWWDGTAWSNHTAPFEAPRAAAASPTIALTAVGSAPTTVGPGDSARTAESMPLHPVAARPSTTRSRIEAEVASSAPYSAFSPSTSSVPFSSNSVGSAGTQVDYEPFAHRRHAEALAHVSHRATTRNPQGLRVHTVSIWLMATMPVTQALLIFWVFSSLPPESSSWTRALAVALPFVLSAALAGQDTRLLESSGHLRTAPWIAALITPPVYLAVRGLRVSRATGASPWPLVIWVIAQLGVIAVWFSLDPAAVQLVLEQLG